MQHKVFIDGESGTTGLEIKKRLSGLDNIKLLSIDENKRKDKEQRLSLFSEADLVFLCLPDEESKAIAGKANNYTKIIDASTAHRTSDSWVYGLPELDSGQRDSIKKSSRVSNPGCHATGFILLTRPLIDEEIISPAAQLNAHSITGYSGGGKSMIAQYESSRGISPGQYGLSQDHKHLPEMMAYGKVDTAPIFTPIVGDFYRGMLISIQLHTSMLSRRMGVDDMIEVYRNRYNDCPLISVQTEKEITDNGFLYADKLKNRDDVQLTICGNDERMTLMAIYDNLGKGASGAAIQNMNIMLDQHEFTGLSIEHN